MIPDHWQPCRRASDGELTGYLVAADDAAPAVVPVTLIGTRLGPAQDVATATALVNPYGLAELAEFWWCRLPTPLAGNAIDVSDPQDGWTWRRVVVVEASPVRCRVRPAMPEPDERIAQVSLPVPVDELLRPTSRNLTACPESPGSLSRALGCRSGTGQAVSGGGREASAARR